MSDNKPPRHNTNILKGALNLTDEAYKHIENTLKKVDDKLASGHSDIKEIEENTNDNGSQ